MINDWVPIPESIAFSYAMMVLGMAIVTVATYYLSKRPDGCWAKRWVDDRYDQAYSFIRWVVRNIIEVVVLAAGYFMGGSVGLGTLCYGNSFW